MGNRLGDEIHAIAIDVSSLTLNLESEISGRIRYEYPSLLIMYKAPFDIILIKSSCWVRHIRMCFLRNNSIWHAPLISHCWGIILVSSSNSYYSYVNFPITEIIGLQFDSSFLPLILSILLAVFLQPLKLLCRTASF